MSLIKSKVVPKFDCKQNRHDWYYRRDIVLEKSFLWFKWLVSGGQYKCTMCGTERNEDMLDIEPFI